MVLNKMIKKNKFYKKYYSLDHGINSRLEYYQVDLLSNIVNRSSSILDIGIA